MSLDICLTGEPIESKCTCSECGNIHITLKTEEYFSANITHNLDAMAEEAGIYKHLWGPEEVAITKAWQLIEPLTRGLGILKSDPIKFEKLNAPNGWGLYKHFIPWVEKYLEACIKYPDANVSVSR
jgi:hypothetical protein